MNNTLLQPILFINLKWQEEELYFSWMRENFSSSKKSPIDVSLTFMNEDIDDRIELSSLDRLSLFGRADELRVAREVSHVARSPYWFQEAQAS